MKLLQASKLKLKNTGGVRRRYEHPGGVRRRYEEPVPDTRIFVAFLATAFMNSLQSVSDAVIFFHGAAESKSSRGLFLDMWKSLKSRTHVC